MVTAIHWRVRDRLAARLLHGAEVLPANTRAPASPAPGTTARSRGRGSHSIAAGESFTRPLIFLPRPRVMCRDTSALTGLPMVPLRIDCRT